MTKQPDSNVSVNDDAATFEQLTAARPRILAELGKAIVGQHEVIEQILIALFAGGHCLITGAPGLAKTLLVKSIAQIFHLQFRRIQFTPDLMPTDITGVEILKEGASGRELIFVPGPIFGNMLLADEINRTPPKTQAAMLEAMQEHQVTAGGRRYALPEPFFVLATQNPIEMENLRDGFHEQRLREAGSAGDEAVSAGKKRDEDLLDHLVLADDRLAEFGEDARARGGELLEGRCVGVGKIVRFSHGKERRHASGTTVRAPAFRAATGSGDFKVAELHRGDSEVAAPRLSASSPKR